MKELRILSELGSNENRALLCEIPQSWADDIEINADGTLDCLAMLKVLKQALMQEVVSKNRKKPTNTGNHNCRTETLKPAGSFSTSGSSQPILGAIKKTPLYEMIFNAEIAVDPEGC